MQVVCNTSPILNLAIIGELDLLQEQFGRDEPHRIVIGPCQGSTATPSVGRHS
jgi:hypothetical protein